MSTPAGELNLSGLLEPPKPRAPAPRISVPRPKVAAPSSGGLKLDGLVEPPRPAISVPAAPRSPSRSAPASVDPRLDSFVNDVIGEASRRTGFKYKLGEGPRTAAQQAGKVAQGFSWTYNSAHMHGRGRDVLAFDERGNYIKDGSHAAYKALGDVYGEFAPKAPARIKWGVVRNGRQVDPGHFELDEDGDPATPNLEATPEPLNLDGLLEPLNLDGVLETAGEEVGDVVKVDSMITNATADRVATPSLPALPSSRVPDVHTTAGRAERDAGRELEQNPNARKWVDVAPGVPDVSILSSNELARRGFRQLALERGNSPTDVDAWLAKNGGSLQIYDLESGKPLTTGEAMGREDIYDLNRRTFRLAAEMPKVIQMEADIKGGRSNVARVAGWLADDSRSAGEKAVDVAGPPLAFAGKGLEKGADLARRVMKPADMFSARLWTRLGGGTPEQARAASDAVWNDQPLPAYAENFVAEDVERDMSRINPRVGKAYGMLTRFLTDPTNLIPTAGAVKLADKFADAVRAVRLARRAEDIASALADVERVVDEARLLKQARPLGLAGESAEAGRIGVVGRVADRLTDEPAAFTDSPLGLRAAGAVDDVPAPSAADALPAESAPVRPASPAPDLEASGRFGVYESGRGMLEGHGYRVEPDARGWKVSDADLTEWRVRDESELDELAARLFALSEPRPSVAVREGRHILRQPEPRATVEPLAPVGGASARFTSDPRPAAEMSGAELAAMGEEVGASAGWRLRRNEIVEGGVVFDYLDGAGRPQRWLVRDAERAGARGLSEVKPAPSAASDEFDTRKAFEEWGGEPLNLDGLVEPPHHARRQPRTPRGNFDGPPAPDVRESAMRLEWLRHRAASLEGAAGRAKDPVQRSELAGLAQDFADEAEEVRVTDVARRVKAGETPTPEEMADLKRAVLSEGGEPTYIEVDVSRPTPAAISVPAPKPRGPVGKVFDKALDAYDTSRSLFASADVSFPGRQGIVPLFMDTRATLRGFGKGMTGTARRQSDVVRWLDTRPSSQMWRDFGLKLDTLEGVPPEMFTSKLAERIPVAGRFVVKPSDRVMSAQADAVRLLNAESWDETLRWLGATPETHPEDYKAVAKFLNAASGNGDLGRVGTALYPVTRRVIFSPKLLKSRFTVINPLTYARMPRVAQKAAGVKLGKLAAKVGGVLGLAYLTADEVGVNPFGGNFLQAKFGETSYDLSGGFANKVKFPFKLAASVYATAEAHRKGEPVEYKDTPWGIAGHFLRSQLAPGYSLPVDVVLGETYDGRPFTWGEGIVTRITPGFTQDVWNGFSEGGGTVGGVKALPAFFGVSSRTRDPQAWAAAREASKLAFAREQTAEVLKDAPGVRDELQRLRLYVYEDDALLAPEIAEAVERAKSRPGWASMKDAQRRGYLENVLKNVRARGLAPDVKRARAAALAKPDERVELAGRAAEEVKRLGVIVDPVFAGHGVAIYSGESVRFKGENIGQAKEMLDAYRQELTEETQAAVERVMSFRGYDSRPDSVKRNALQNAIVKVKARERGPFHYQTRRRYHEAREGVEEMQRRLEGRSRQVRPGETLKVGDATPRPLMNTEGMRESRNVEDRRDSPGRAAAGSSVAAPRLMNFDGQRESVNVEDRRGVSPLVEEVRRAGASPVTETEAADVALLLEGVEPERFKSFARSLDDTLDLGAVGEGADAAFETAARVVGSLGSRDARGAADVTRARRLLAREIRLRPEQFRRDAFEGRYGDRMREKAAEWFEGNFSGRPATGGRR